ncbi:MAG: hypothetical protein ACK2T7_12990 [Anaerolineales bacterium]
MADQQIKVKWWDHVPGVGASLIVFFVNAMWAVWGLGEMFFEGWYGGWGIRLAYMSVFFGIFALSVAAMLWPRIGGWLMIAGATAFTLWWWMNDLIRGTFTWQRFLGQFPISGILVIAGGLFLWQASVKRKRQRLGLVPAKWWRRNLALLVTLGIPVLITIGMLAVNLPTVLARVDDGDRGARTIVGSDGVALVWAPKGPGWNWQQEWGGYPSWNSIARYGMGTVGIDKQDWSYGDAHATQAEFDQYNVCRYLVEDGLSLADEPQDIWRMPKVAELVAASALHGENAGCVWNGELAQMECELTPDKETPLWAPDESPVYYWAYEEYDQENAYYISFNGWVKQQPKSWGNPRHGYRCVKDLP